LAEQNEHLVRFVRKLTALRRKYPILRRSRFLSGEMNEEIGIKEITWINATGTEMQPEQWSDDLMLCFGMLLDGRAQATGIRQRGQDATILIVFNSYHDVVQFTLPGTTDSAFWLLLIDTNQPDDAITRTAFEPGDVYEVTGRSLLMFSMVAETEHAKDEVREKAEVKK
jgi:isoamylase